MNPCQAIDLTQCESKSDLLVNVSTAVTDPNQEWYGVSPVLPVLVVRSKGISASGRP